MSHLHYNTQQQPCQEGQPVFLLDTDERGRVKPWHIYKLDNAYISCAYEAVNMNKAERLAACADTLLFRRTDSGKLRLASAHFCRVRLCPICAWRRSLKTHAHMRKILNAAPDNLSYIMVTLTLRNCTGDDLSATLDTLISGYKRLVKRSRLQSWVGWYRGVEVTHNIANDTYHPHIHALVAVSKRYYKTKDYIKQSELASLWRDVCHLDYDPVVDIRKVYARRSGADSIISAVCEVAKYATKAGDIINFEDWDMTCDTVRILDKALDRRRFVAFGGLFKRLHAQLNLDDEDDGDLVHLDSEDAETDKNSEQLLFLWHTGYNRYIKS